MYLCSQRACRTPPPPPSPISLVSRSSLHCPGPGESFLSPPDQTQTPRTRNQIKPRDQPPRPLLLLASSNLDSLRAETKPSLSNPFIAAVAVGKINHRLRFSRVRQASLFFPSASHVDATHLRSLAHFLSSLNFQYPASVRFWPSNPRFNAFLAFDSFLRRPILGSFACRNYCITSLLSRLDTSLPTPFPTFLRG